MSAKVAASYGSVVRDLDAAKCELTGRLDTVSPESEGLPEANIGQGLTTGQ